MRLVPLNPMSQKFSPKDYFTCCILPCTDSNYLPLENKVWSTVRNEFQLTLLKIKALGLPFHYFLNSCKLVNCKFWAMSITSIEKYTLFSAKQRIL